MSIWDDLLEVGIGFVSDPEALDAALDAALELLGDEEPTKTRAALKFAKAHVDKIAHIAPAALAGLTGTLATHGPIKARLEYLRLYATMAELHEAQEDAHRAAAEESVHNAWVDDVLPVLKALAPALPFLLAVL